jgi:CRP-like cAMP-binding protein
MADDYSETEIDNRLLRALPSAFLRGIRNDLEHVELRHNAVLFEVEEPLRYLIFPARRSMVSMLCVNEDGDLAEVGIVGNEGVLGVDLVLEGAESSHRALVQIPGTGWRLKASTAAKLLASDENFRHACLRYGNFLIRQVSQTALCNRLHSVEERLARWLLMSAERAESDELPLTHEMLGHMLGTRRATVTLTASMFQEAGLIRYQRGRITILHRKKLEQATCACFRVQQNNLRKMLAGK